MLSPVFFTRIDDGSPLSLWFSANAIFQPSTFSIKVCLSVKIQQHDLVIYRNALLGTLNFNGTQIIGFIQEWVNNGPLIEIGGNSVRVDRIIGVGTR